MLKIPKFHFFALAAHGEGISGGDRIFIEFARNWSKKVPVTLHVSQEGYLMCRRFDFGEKNTDFKISNIEKWSKFNFAFNYFSRIIEGVRVGLLVNVVDDPLTVVYSASHFWMDFIPGFLLKLRYKKTKWIVGWYQTAPNPLKGFAEGDREQRFRVLALIHWLIQLPLRPIVRRYSDFIFVNNQDEKKQFKGTKGEIIVVLGAVDLEKIRQWKKQNRELPKFYDAVFQGRFHPQKGVVELIDIWKKVVDKKPNAKLAMIGDGQLRKNVELRIKNYKLEKNIKLLGYLFDGPEKYRIFSQSRIVVHPAFYDSGGMAAAEAMAFGLPCIGFNLKSYKYYYPKGMIKVGVGDLDAFAKTIINLLDDKKFRKSLGKEAKSMIESFWSWEQRAKEIYQSLHLQ